MKDKSVLIEPLLLFNGAKNRSVFIARYATLEKRPEVFISS